MKTLCAHCQAVIKEGSEANGISHGICAACLKVHYPEFADEILAGISHDAGTN